jgi:hypothetical protein
VKTTSVSAERATDSLTWRFTLDKERSVRLNSFIQQMKQSRLLMSYAQKSDCSLMKQVNQSLVLQLIQSRGPISHKDIATASPRRCGREALWRCVRV